MVEKNREADPETSRFERISQQLDEALAAFVAEAGAKKAAERARELGDFARTHLALIKITAAVEAREDARLKRRAARAAASVVAARADDDDEQDMKDVDELEGEALERELVDLERKVAALHATYAGAEEQGPEGPVGGRPQRTAVLCGPQRGPGTQSEAA